MKNNPSNLNNRYIFYKDERIIAIGIILIAIILQISQFTKTPVLITIHSYTIGVLFGVYSPIFYFFCIFSAMKVLFKKVKIFVLIRFSDFKYWVLALLIMGMLVSWIYYIPKLGFTANSLGDKGFRNSFSMWWNNFSHTPSHWSPGTTDAGVIGAFLFSSLSSFASTIGTAIIFSLLSLIALFFIISRLWKDLRQNLKRISKNRNIKNRASSNNSDFNNSVVTRENPFIKIHKEEPTRVNELPFEDVTSLGVLEEKDLSELNAKSNEKWSKYNIEYTRSYAINDTKKISSAIQQDIDKKRNALNNLFSTFGIEARVVDYIFGPTITKFIIKSAPNVNLKKFENISQNIKMVLQSKEIRMELPIPGKPFIGIEFPNVKREMVKFFDIFEDIKKSKLLLPVVLGKNIEGKSIIMCINKAPHLLVAGATGSGKSAAINIIIASLIMTKSPRDVRLVLIDPKMVEFMPFNDIPHLLSPIITDPKMAAHNLDVLVDIMESRYKVMSQYKVKKIQDYNKIADANNLEYWPYIVIIIDELADLMAASSKLVENSIQRLTQKSRAAGIHLIIATQRPSTNVVTGVIKANIPSRIAFSVSAGIDSKVILDFTGAEKLIGKGDMLISLYGEYMQRAQGAFLEDSEVVKIINQVKKYGKPDYDPRLMEKIETIEETIEKTFKGY